MKAGVYIVKDLFSEQKYILSLNGKEPFIRITNSISLSSFANGLIERDHKIVEQILEDRCVPEQMRYGGRSRDARPGRDGGS